MSNLSAAAIRQRRAWLAVATAAAASAAGLLASRRAAGCSLRIQTRRDVKIDADALLDRHLIRCLQRDTSLPILTEESGFVPGTGASRGYRWIVDPLDGSLNHSRGLPLSAVSIGLWRGITPVLGVVHDLGRSDVFTGIVHVGAWLNGRPMMTSAVSAANRAVLCTGFPAGTDFGTSALSEFVRGIRKYQKVRLLGSAALSLAYVASGRGDVYRERDIMLWDVAAGIALVRAAGGCVSMKAGRRPLAYFVTATNGRLIASAGNRTVG